jgi:hypothetical protein
MKTKLLLLSLSAAFLLNGQSISVSSGEIRYASLELVVDTVVSGTFNESSNRYDFREGFRSKVIALQAGEVANILTVPGFRPSVNELSVLNLHTVEATYPSGAKVYYRGGEFVVGPAELSVYLEFYGSTDKASAVAEYTSVASVGIYAPDSGNSAYMASNAVVIPEDASGPVEIILESSTDLINWSYANPGTYGANEQKRFFRLSRNHAVGS